VVEVLQSQQSDDRRTLDFSRLSRWGRQEDVEEVWRVARHFEHEGEGRLIGTPIVSGYSRSERLKILTIHEPPSIARLATFKIMKTRTRSFVILHLQELTHLKMS